MRKETILLIFQLVTAFLLLVIILTKVVVEPWINRKIQALVMKESGDYHYNIEKIRVPFFRSGVELENITMYLKRVNDQKPIFSIEIESVKLRGIRLLKAIFRNNIHIKEIIIFNSRIIGKVDFPLKTGSGRLSPSNINVNALILNKLNINVKSATTSQSYFLKNGVFKVYNIKIVKQDTLSADIFVGIDFDAPEFKTVTHDSLYTYLAVGTNYSSVTNSLTVTSFTVQPNYTEYEFVARDQFETDRIEGRFSQISICDFSAADYVKSGSMTSSYIEIGDVKLNVFRDKRKEFRHTVKPTFQDIIYGYPGSLNIDSIGILSGDIVYSEHAEKAIEKGVISFNHIDAMIYKITNDTIFKTKKAYLELNANALLMGKGKVNILLKARIFDNQKTFALNGTLGEMSASDLNPFLEKYTFITITSGIINSMHFSFSANNTNATGKLKLLYQGLIFAAANNQTGKAVGIVEQAMLLIADIFVMESNPMPEEEVRPGIIEYERDQEKFLFNYIVKALMSGIKTSFTKT